MTPSDCLSAHGFRSFFTPLPGCFSPFPHGTLRYRSSGVFSLGRWSSRIQAGFLVPRPTRGPPRSRVGFSDTGLSPSPAGLPDPSPTNPVSHSSWDAPRPRPLKTGLGSSPFARRYLGNRGCFLLLGVLRCFSSPGLPSTTYAFSRRCRLSQTAGSPIRTPPDQRLLTAPRGVSAFAPSFFGSQRLGIHRAPFLLSLAAWLFSSQGTMKEPRSLRIKQYAHPNPFSLPCSLERR